jgi:hypothetical protein
MSDTQAEHHQMMLERMQMLEASLRRGIDGVATVDDWKTILLECGVDQRQFLKQSISGVNNGTYSEIK